MNTGQAQNLTPEQQEALAAVRNVLHLLPPPGVTESPDLTLHFLNEARHAMEKVADAFPEGEAS